MEETVLKILIEKIPLSDSLKSQLNIDKLHTIVSGGIVQLKNMGALDISTMGISDKIPQIQDVIAIAGKFAASLAPFKIGGKDKQAVVLGLIDVMLEYISIEQPAFKEKLEGVRRMARETLPAVLTLAVNAARGDLSADLRRKPGQSIGDYARSIGRKLISFGRALAPSFVVCGLSSSAILDKGDAIVGPPPRALLRESTESLGPEQSEKEKPHYTTPRESVGEEDQTSKDIHQSCQGVEVEETQYTKIRLEEIIDGKELEARKAVAASVLYSA